MKRVLTTREYERMMDEYEKVKYKCNRCGRKIVIPEWVDKNVCDWCGHYVFKNKKDEFIYRMREKL